MEVSANTLGGASLGGGSAALSLPTPSSEIARTRKRIQAIAQGVRGMTAERVKLGTYNVDADTDLFRTMISASPLLMVLPGRLKSRDQTSGSTRFDIPCELYFGFQNDQDFEWTTIEDLIFDSDNGLLAAFGNTPNWRPVGSFGSSIPQNIDFSPEPEIRSDLKPCVAAYRWTFEFTGC